MKFNSSQYVNYEEMVQVLEAFAAQHPNLVQLSTIGTSAQQRKIWKVAVSDHSKRLSEDKPTFLIDANMHASEVSGTQVCLYSIQKIINDFESNSVLQDLLEKITIVFIPRVCPDAAESYLKNHFEIRSSLYEWPSSDLPHQFVAEDMDGDGVIRLMRVQDPSGTFRCSKKNPEIMVQRTHDDYDPKEIYYNLYPEGRFKTKMSDTGAVRKQNFSSQFGLDLNRQFPAEFRPEGQQKGAGPYPGFVPESKSMIEFVSRSKRLFGHLNLHTYGGLILREPSCLPDEKIPESDVLILNRLAERAAEVSGYIKVNTYKDFRYTDRDVATGTLSDWAYLHRGLFSSVVEIWDVWKAAGLQVKDHVSRYFNPTEDDLVKIFAWAKKTLPNNSFYSRWKKYKHPDFGQVEIGGWSKERVFRNPPEKFLKSECEKVYQIIFSQIKTAPMVMLKKKSVKKLNGNQYLITAHFQNVGFLPTNGSEQAVRVEAVQLPQLQLQLQKSQKLVGGEYHQEVSHLKGRSRMLPWHTPLGFVTRPNNHESQMQWTIQGKGEVTISADFQRGGLLKLKIKI